MHININEIVINRSPRTVSEKDYQVLSLQLGRSPRAVVGIAARCVCGNPLVTQTLPRLPDGLPFPTMYYLTHPRAVAMIGRLESSGLMADMTRRLSEDEDLAQSYLAAHQSYLEERNQLAQHHGLDPVLEIAGFSAGGMPNRVKCLHALLGHTLAVGTGVNPFGDEALDLLVNRSWWRPDICFCDKENL